MGKQLLGGGLRQLARFENGSELCWQLPVQLSQASELTEIMSEDYVRDPKSVRLK